MSACGPFAVSSKCVTRSKANPDVILEVRETEDDTRTNAAALCDDPGSPSANNCMPSCMYSSKERLESGWVSRSIENDMVSHENCTRMPKSVQTLTWDASESSSQRDNTTAVNATAHVGPPAVLRRGLTSAYGLPHPSKLRKKGNTTTKRTREFEREEAVAKHIQLLKKKRDIYFPSEPRITPTDENTEPTAAPAYEDRGTHSPLVIPERPPTPEECRASMVSVPATHMCLAEDDDKQWLKRHWQSGQQREPQKHSEE